MARSIGSILSAAASLIRSNAPARMARCLAAAALCVLVSGAITPASVRADGLTPAYVPGQAYVHYTENHVLCAVGTLTALADTTSDSDGHVYDLYGNQVIFNADNSISDASNTVVGFVCATATP